MFYHSDQIFQVFSADVAFRVWKTALFLWWGERANSRRSFDTPSPLPRYCVVSPSLVRRIFFATSSLFPRYLLALRAENERRSIVFDRGHLWLSVSSVAADLLPRGEDVAARVRWSCRRGAMKLPQGCNEVAAGISFTLLEPITLLLELITINSSIYNNINPLRRTLPCLSAAFLHSEKIFKFFITIIQQLSPNPRNTFFLSQKTVVYLKQKIFFKGYSGNACKHTLEKILLRIFIITKNKL